MSDADCEKPVLACQEDDVIGKACFRVWSTASLARLEPYPEDGASF
jgi:hypothetical protein